MTKSLSTNKLNQSEAIFVDFCDSSNYHNQHKRKSNAGSCSVKKYSSNPTSRERQNMVRDVPSANSGRVSIEGDI